MCVHHLEGDGMKWYMKGDKEPYQHGFPFLNALTSMLASFVGFRRSSLGFEGLEIILDDLPFARAPAAVTAPPEGPR